MLRRKRPPRPGEKPRKSRGLGAVMERWLAWNIFQVGEPVSPNASFTFWYREEVLFSSHVPCARLLFDDQGNWLVVTSTQSSSDWRVNGEIIKKHGGAGRIIYADNLGVFGHMGMKMPVPEFVNTLFQQLEDKARWHIEGAAKTGPNAAATGLHLHETGAGYGRVNWRVRHVNILAEQFARLARFTRQQHRHSALLDNAEGTIVKVLKKTVEDYKLPERVKQRERAQAIREAKRALLEGSAP